tara:strand:- start:1242 stop:1538 length:297 start_codon:yes stop_codon:yes gene_type:complete
MTDIDKCPDCKNEYDENDVWHGVMDLQLWKTTSICDGCFEEDGGYRYKNNADIEGLITEVERLRKLEDVVREAFSEDSKYASGEYMNTMGEILGVIER